MATDEGQEQGSNPGERLRRAREAMGRSPEDMSEELRLSVDQVRSLEAEAFHRLPGEAYIRGYLRNYAAAVGVPPEEIIAAYEQLPEGSGDVGAEEDVPLVPAPERPLIEHPWRVVWVSLALLVVVTVVTLWLVGESRRPALPEQSGSSAPADAGSPASPDSGQAPQDSSEDSPAEDGNGETAGEPVAGPEDTPAEPAQKPSGSGSTAEQSAADSASDEGSGSGRGPEQEQTDEEGAETESQTAATSRPEGTALSGPGLEAPRLPELPGRNDDGQQAQSDDLQTLRVHTWADSWIEVADDRGRTLLRRLVKEGRDVRLYGEAPFQVKVGNAAGVQLYFEGQPLTPLGDQGEVVALNVDGESPTVAESEVAPPGESEPEPEMAGTESEEANATAE